MFNSEQNFVCVDWSNWLYGGEILTENGNAPLHWPAVIIVKFCLEQTKPFHL